MTCERGLLETTWQTRTIAILTLLMICTCMQSQKVLGRKHSYFYNSGKDNRFFFNQDIRLDGSFYDPIAGQFCVTVLY